MADGLTTKQLKQIETILDAVLEGIKPLGVRLLAAEARIAELEAKPSMKYFGVWTSGQQFNEGNLVTDGGSMWHCRRSTRDRPGASADWQLAVKRGKDAR